MRSVAAQEKHARGASRKRKELSVAARPVAAQQKRTVQDAEIPTTSAERMRFMRQQAREALERIAAEATAGIAAEAAAASPLPPL